MLFQLQKRRRRGHKWTRKKTKPAADEYEVEAIVDNRTDHTTGVTEYLIMWKGFGADENTWEPLHHLANAMALVTEYNKAISSSS